MQTLNLNRYIKNEIGGKNEDKIKANRNNNMHNHSNDNAKWSRISR